jgi:hypothetical protein
LKIPEGVRVTLYEHADFEGDMRIFDADTPWVGNDFNDKTSSILIEPVATIYEHGDYQGRIQRLSPGKYNIGDLVIGNDRLSSLKVPEGIRVTLYEHANFMGNEKRFDTDSPWVGDDFNDKTSSVLVELVKTEGTSEEIKQNIIVKKPDNSGISDCVEFSVSFYDVFGAGGKICKNGILTVQGKFIEIPITEQTIDLREKSYSRKYYFGAEELKIEFYLKDSCLWTKGYLDGWFHENMEWNEKIVSFDDKFNNVTSLTVDIYAKLKGYNCADEAAKFLKNSIPGVTSDVLAAALKGAGYGLNEIGNALQKVGCVPNEIASALRKAGYNASEVAKFMKAFIPNMTGEVMAVALKGAGYGLNEVGNALKEVGYGIETISSALKRAGYNASEAANFIRYNIPGVTGEVLAAALRSAGYRLNEIGTALQVVGYGVETIASALRKAGYNANEVAKFMKEFIPGITGEVMDNVLKNAGYGLNEVENALKGLGGKFAELIGKIPIPPIKPPWKLF